MEHHDHDHPVPSDLPPSRLSQQVHSNGRVLERNDDATSTESVSQVPRDGTRNTRVNGIASNLPEDLPPNDPPNPGQRLSNTGITQGSAGITSRTTIPTTAATVTVNGHSIPALRPSPATLSDSVPTVLQFGPSTNPSDILQGLDEFIDQSLLRQGGDLNFERDYGRWFSPDDEELHVSR